jgi:hypothetical protein
MWRRIQFKVQCASNWFLGFWSMDPCLQHTNVGQFFTHVKNLSSKSLILVLTIKPSFDPVLTGLLSALDSNFILFYFIFCKSLGSSSTHKMKQESKSRYNCSTNKILILILELIPKIKPNFSLIFTNQKLEPMILTLQPRSPLNTDSYTM